MKGVLAILWKDIISEARTREMMNSMFIFAILIIVVFQFAFSPGTERIHEIASGVLWVAFLFAGILGLNRSFAIERDRGCLRGLLLCPVDRSVIYLGKVLGNLIFIMAVNLITLLVFVIFFNISVLPVLAKLMIIVLLATIGYSAVGTLFSAISCNTRMREVMLPILMLPIMVPVIIAAVKATVSLFSGGSEADFTFGLRLMGVFDAVFIVVSIAVFDYVVEE
jgi:heme exporter protein B